jgi:hypothetical protein
MSIMGWTEMATAQRYTHAVDELRRRAARRMGALLWDERSAGDAFAVPWSCVDWPAAHLEHPGSPLSSTHVREC